MSLTDKDCHQGRIRTAGREWDMDGTALRRCIERDTVHLNGYRCILYDTVYRKGYSDIGQPGPVCKIYIVVSMGKREEMRVSRGGSSTFFDAHFSSSVLISTWLSLVPSLAGLPHLAVPSPPTSYNA